MEIIIDKIAIWRENLNDKFSVRKIPANTRYRDDVTGIYLISDKPMFRYAKNYKKGKTKFCLFVRTFREDASAIEVELDKIAKTIDEEYAKKINAISSIENFEYLNERLKGNN